MNIKNILVAYNGSDGIQSALMQAAALARHHDADVTGLLAHAAFENYAAESRWIPTQTREIIEKAHAQVLDAVESRFHEDASALELGDNLHFMRIPGRVDTVCAQVARSFDLVLLGQLSDHVDDPHLLLHPDKIALQSGRPVLVVPKAAEPRGSFSRAVIAWDGRRAAARAVADSLSLMAPGAGVSIATAGERELPRPASDLAIHLARHGFEPDETQLEAGGGVAEALLSHCRKNSADLLVMGAYEHSKFRTDILGSLSAAILKECPVPVLMSY